MPTLVLPPRHTPDSIALVGAAVESGWAVERLQRWHAPDALHGQSDVVLYGEPLFVAAIAEQLDLAVLEPPFDWLPFLPQSHLQRWVQAGTLEQARAWPSMAFFKPADDACFQAGIYDDGGALEVADIVPADTPVLISEPVHWELEFRLFVLDGVVVTASIYHRGMDLARNADGEWPATDQETEAALAFAESVLEDDFVELPPAVVLDVGLVMDLIGPENGDLQRGWAIVEANPAWGSGLYGCNPAEVLRTLERATLPATATTPADSQWVLSRT